MKRLPELLKRQSEIITEIRAIEKAANDANRDLETREEERSDALHAELDTVAKRIGNAKLLDAAERAAHAEPVTEPGRDTFENECRNVALLDFVALQADIERGGTDFGRVRELSQECARRMGRPAQGIYVPLAVFNTEKRVVLAATSGAGAVGTDHRSDLTINMLRSASILPVLGATYVNNLSAPMTIPAIDQGGTVEWFADSGSITGADMDINSRTLTPHHAACITDFSRSMVVQSDPSVNDMATRDFARALASAVDAVALQGGNGAEPSGILDQITPGTCATPTYEQVLALIEAVEVANAQGASMGFALHPSTVRKLRSTLVAASTDSRMIMEGPNQLLGYPAQASTGMPLTGSPVAGSILFGDWSSLVVGTFGPGIDVIINPFESASYRRGGISVRGIISCDVALRHEESFAGALDVAL